jgi:multisubunit Na+/H+ antiporter MnhB subunit
MKLTKSQTSAIIVFTVSLILFALNQPDAGFIGLILGGLLVIN